MNNNSYKTILRSSSIIGASSVINIAAGLLKMKVAAVLLGPAGIGLLGFYQNLIQTAASIAAMGVNGVGMRQIAQAQAAGGDEAVGVTRRALFWGTLVMALLGALAFWLMSGWIARVFLGDEARSGDIAWLAVGVALTVASGSQSALLTGMRRIGDLARLSVGAGVLSAAFGVTILWIWGSAGLLAMILVAPLISLLLGHWYVAKLGPPAGASARLPELLREWNAMVKLGLAFMVGGLVTTLGLLAVRILVQRELGIEALGQFQAAWAIGMTYLGFVLGAMGADYYPRLSAAIHDPATATKLVNEQTEVALLLCAPALLAMLGLAPWIIQLLYTPQFAPAVEILRWQLLGDILKIMSWPLGFVLLAAGAGKAYVVTESIGIGVFVASTAIGMRFLGIQSTGVAFLALYVIYLPLVRWQAGRRIGFMWSRAVVLQALAVVLAAVVVELLARSSPEAGAAGGVALATLAGGFAVARLSTMTDAGGVVSRVTQTAKSVSNWISSRR